VPDHDRLLRQLADQAVVVIRHLRDRLVREHLRVLVGLLDGLGIVRPSGRKRRVAGLLEDRRPPIPAARQEPKAVDEHHRRQP
jgi:hypothetical protein